MGVGEKSSVGGENALATCTVRRKEKEEKQGKRRGEKMAVGVRKEKENAAIGELIDHRCLIRYLGAAKSLLIYPRINGAYAGVTTSNHDGRERERESERAGSPT